VTSATAPFRAPARVCRRPWRLYNGTGTSASRGPLRRDEAGERRRLESRRASQTSGRFAFGREDSRRCERDKSREQGLRIRAADVVSDPASSRRQWSRLADVPVPVVESPWLRHTLAGRDGAVALVTIKPSPGPDALNSQTIDELRRVILDLKRDESVSRRGATGAGEKASSRRRISMSSRSRRRPADAITRSPASMSSTWSNTGEAGDCGHQKKTATRSAAAASWRWRARCGWPDSAGRPAEIALASSLATADAAPAATRRQGRALEIILTGTAVTAEEAAPDRSGQSRVSRRGVDGRSRKLAHQLRRAAPIATRYIISAVIRGLKMPFADASVYRSDRCSGWSHRLTICARARRLFSRNASRSSKANRSRGFGGFGGFGRFGRFWSAPSLAELRMVRRAEAGRL